MESSMRMLLASKGLGPSNKCVCVINILQSLMKWISLDVFIIGVTFIIYWLVKDIKIYIGLAKTAC